MYTNMGLLVAILTFVSIIIEPQLIWIDACTLLMNQHVEGIYHLFCLNVHRIQQILTGGYVRDRCSDYMFTCVLFYSVFPLQTWESLPLQ